MTSIYSLTIFTSAFLLFLVQPMMSKLLLPSLGGTPAVWNTAMVFFQTMLLLGYLYAHYTTRWLGLRRQAWLHGALLLVSVAWLPVGLATLESVDSGQPIRWILWTLACSVGVPFFVLSANAPLVQYWYARSGRSDAANPYFLYGASNIGSLLALLGYPLLAEPLLNLMEQRYFWSGLYVIFLFCLAACVHRVYRQPDKSGGVEDSEAPAPTLADRLKWVALAFFPSSLLLGVTTFITTDIASAPLFWVVPLALYLLTFIFAFARRPLLYGRALNAQLVLVPLAVLALVYRINASWVLLLHLYTFFALAMGCHGRLAQSRPSGKYLTGFYVCLSVGGMLGGFFNSLLAPVLFTEPVEYPLMLILCLLARPLLGEETRRAKRLDYALPVLFIVALVVLFFTARALVASPVMWHVQLLGVAVYLLTMGMAYLSYRRPIRFTLLMLSLFIALPVVGMPGGTKESAEMLYAERNFFGVNRVFKWPSENMMLLKHGTTVHGIQGLEKDRLYPASYYSTIRDAVPLLPSLDRTAVIGLGAGALACVGHAGQVFDFYEIDPAVASIARNPDYFTFLRDCGPATSITLGDGRLEIAKAPSGNYNMVVIDAFTSDAIPMHLLTREALAIYRDKLAPRGVIAFNISNRHLNLRPVMAALAKDAGMTAYINDNRHVSNPLAVPSVWVMMASSPGVLQSLAKHDPRWVPLESPGARVWTDHYSNIMQTLF